MENWLREVAHKALGTISNRADRPWTVAQFAAAVAYQEVMLADEARRQKPPA